jgi:hypothetical protein
VEDKLAEGGLGVVTDREVGLPVAVDIERGGSGEDRLAMGGSRLEGHRRHDVDAHGSAPQQAQVSLRR